MTTLGRAHPADLRPRDDDSWWTRPETYPGPPPIPLPSGPVPLLPPIQFPFGSSQAVADPNMAPRRDAVKAYALRSWQAYRNYSLIPAGLPSAPLADELSPLSKQGFNRWGGCAMTAVDSLDTLWIMGLKEEFEQAVHDLANVNITNLTIPIPLFEINIRYLGGLLSANDLTNGAYPELLTAATLTGDVLLRAFDTPNRFPNLRWDWRSYAAGHAQNATDEAVLAELGTLSLEFTRLAQVTNQPKYFDAIQRITDALDKAQNQTTLPGLWPPTLNTSGPSLTWDAGQWYDMGGGSDSIYEYLPKEFLLLGGRSDQYRRMYESAIAVAKQQLFFQPMNKDNQDILLSGYSSPGANGSSLDPLGEELACFTGGMLALGAKIFNRPDDLVTAQQLTDGCYWAYTMMPTGIMPEVFRVAPCPSNGTCSWKEDDWKQGVAEMYQPGANARPESIEKVIESTGLQPGFTQYLLKDYDLRPEAIEALFYMYRITGNSTYQDMAWTIFEAIQRYTETDVANAPLIDVTNTTLPSAKGDDMETFWLAETLKYLFLIFSDPSTISLDEWVLYASSLPRVLPVVFGLGVTNAVRPCSNTEAHPFKRPTPHP
ncbi:MAG: hypothetical protein M1838_005697 [Thelocarpon superellum]|nr:MAG: hypothetical protein M1838_005697 [Thelocarpon superellum]